MRIAHAFQSFTLYNDSQSTKHRAFHQLAGDAKEVSGNRYYAFAVKWWNRWRDVSPVSDALKQSQGEFWADKLDSIFEANKVCGRSPKTMSEFSRLINRNASNVGRVLNGRSSLTTQDLIAIATVLDVSITYLVPNPEFIVLRSVQILCGELISDADATAYSRYVLSGSAPFNPHLDHALCERLQLKLTGHYGNAADLEEAVMRVGDSLVPMLELAEQNDKRLLA